jgi:glycosyltransferase involved in cell wall biosynthesis
MACSAETMKHNNWITCTPVAFRGDEKTFFSRDTGLCCRALQSLGAKAKAVMPGPAWDDEPDVLRVPYNRLSEPAFWREQGADAVVLYSWADPRYTSIAKAIKDGGLKLFLNMDTDGLISPFIEPSDYVRKLWVEERLKRGFLAGSLRSLCRLGWQCAGLHKHFSRLRHMDCADAIGTVSPVAVERIKRYVRFFGRNDIAQKIHYVSHPVDPAMRYTGCVKQVEVVAVGRWDEPVKRPDMLVDVAVGVLSRHPDVQFVIVGKDAARCAAEIAVRIPFAQDRAVGYERLEHDQLCEQMSRAQISLCTSRSESFHIASGEALLCGCSVVAPRRIQMPSFLHFIDEGRSGRLSDDHAEALADAVLMELAAWRNGERDPTTIAQSWRNRVGADEVVCRIDALI